MHTAHKALEQLRTGNRRFMAGIRSLEPLMSHSSRMDFVAGQKPIAIIIGCSDSRAPVELIFDQGRFRRFPRWRA